MGCSCQHWRKLRFECVNLYEAVKKVLVTLPASPNTYQAVRYIPSSTTLQAFVSIASLPANCFQSPRKSAPLMADGEHVRVSILPTKCDKAFAATT